MKIDPPNKSGELVVAAVKSLAGLVPYLGGFLTEAVALYDPVKKRREAWEQMLTSAVMELQERHSLNLDSIMRNEAFVSFALQASDIAMRNHQREKLDALRNAIVSVGEPHQLNEDLAFQFLRYVEVLTCTHIKMLASMSRNPDAMTRCTTFGDVCRELELLGFSQLSREVMRAFLRDLQAVNLLNLADLGDLDGYQSGGQIMWTSGATGTAPPIVTDLGKQFLTFVGAEFVDRKSI